MPRGWTSFWEACKRQAVESHRRASRFTLLLLASAWLIGACLGWGQAVYGQQGNAERAAPGLKGLPEVSVQIGGAQGDGGSLIQVMVLFTLLTLAPSILIMMTPFTRIIIVLSLLRNAMGTQQAPPNNVLIGMALFLSFFIMSPTLNKINTDAVKPYMDGQLGYDAAMDRAQAPLSGFMRAQTRPGDMALFVDMAKLDKDNMKVSEIPMHVLVPAFMTSELKSAFQIGFVIYLPFLVIDMVVSAILMSMGMLMLPPVLVSLPFKLLMFVLSDGWNLIFGSLVKSYKAAAL
jgi:flagellar biosynthetic protein FliP